MEFVQLREYRRPTGNSGRVFGPKKTALLFLGKNTLETTSGPGGRFANSSAATVV